MSEKKTLIIVLIVSIIVVSIGLGILGLSIGWILQSSDQIQDSLENEPERILSFNPTITTEQYLGEVYLTAKRYDIVIKADKHNVSEFNWELEVQIINNNSNITETNFTVTSSDSKTQGSANDIYYEVISSFTPSKEGYYKVIIQFTHSSIPSSITGTAIVFYEGNLTIKTAGLFFGIIGIVIGGIVLLLGLGGIGLVVVGVIFKDDDDQKPSSTSSHTPPSTRTKPTTPYEEKSPTMVVEESNYLLCPKCSKKNPTSANFCEFCGSLTVDKCSSCGSSRMESDKFCNNCGQKFL